MDWFVFVTDAKVDPSVDEFSAGYGEIFKNAAILRSWQVRSDYFIIATVRPCLIETR